jgi:RNA polymerase sigma factor (sigma-70 family)
MPPEKRLATNNHSLVADLYQNYAPALLMYICRQVPTREDAEDILLEVFQAAVESEILTTLDSGKRRSWLWTVARNKATDHHRRTHRRPLASMGLEEVEEALYEDDFYAPESSALRQEAYAELRRHVSSLPELQQKILRLRFAHGLTCNEIAQHLNKSSVAIRVMLSRSLNLLRDIYKQRKEEKTHGPG